MPFVKESIAEQIGFVRWERGGWDNEWRLVLSGSGAGNLRQAWAPALTALRAAEPLASRRNSGYEVRHGDPHRRGG